MYYENLMCLSSLCKKNNSIKKFLILVFFLINLFQFEFLEPFFDLLISSSLKKMFLKNVLPIFKFYLIKTLLLVVLVLRIQTTNSNIYNVNSQTNISKKKQKICPIARHSDRTLIKFVLIMNVYASVL